MIKVRIPRGVKIRSFSPTRGSGSSQLPVDHERRRDNYCLGRDPRFVSFLHRIVTIVIMSRHLGLLIKVFISTAPLDLRVVQRKARAQGLSARNSRAQQAVVPASSSGPNYSSFSPVRPFKWVHLHS
ncbi:hypothetical protein J6590_007174 [Homalodisca vitripennis]|nr:hypothetical protein J6590_007174 [Homalodisca vitripennis]